MGGSVVPLLGSVYDILSLRFVITHEKSCSLVWKATSAFGGDNRLCLQCDAVSCIVHST